MKFIAASILISFLVHSNDTKLVSFSEKNWLALSYSKIKPNEIKFGENLSIKVDGSAGPLVYPLKKPAHLKRISIEADIKGSLNLSKEKQGHKKGDDFLLRVGVVYSGEKTLNFFQRKIAADWINTLFNLAPKGSGVDHIHFFNTFSDPDLKGKRRTHPLSDLLIEEFVLENKKGKVRGTFDLDSSRKILGLWVSSDGDDTGSKFLVDIKKITLIK